MAANNEHFRRLERACHAAPINLRYRPVMEEGTAQVTPMTARPEFFHAAHADRYSAARSPAVPAAASALFPWNTRSQT